jgi:hypothetical protein
MFQHNDVINPDSELADAFAALLEIEENPPPADPTLPHINYRPSILEVKNILLKPIPQPIDPFQAPVGGQLGLNRLDSVVRYTSAIIDTVFEGHTTINQNHAALQVIISCMPTITTPSECSQHMEEYLKYLGIDKSEIDNPELEGATSLLARLNCRRFRTTLFLAIIFPRQCGKTTIVAIVMTAILLACPGVKIGVYATVLSQAEITTSQVFSNIKQICPEWKGKTTL